MKAAIATAVAAAVLGTGLCLGLMLSPEPAGPISALDEPLRAYREGVMDDMLAGKVSTRATRNMLVSKTDAQMMMDLEFKLAESGAREVIAAAFEQARLGGVRLDLSKPPALSYVVLLKNPSPADEQWLTTVPSPIPMRIEATPFSMAEIDAIQQTLLHAINRDFGLKARVTGMYFDAVDLRIVVETLSGEERPIRERLRQFPALSQLPLRVRKGRYGVDRWDKAASAHMQTPPGARAGAELGAEPA